MAAHGSGGCAEQTESARTLYNQRRYSQARTLLAEWEAAAPGGWKPPSRRSADAMGPAERELYDRWRPYRQLSEWLEQ